MGFPKGIYFVIIFEVALQISFLVSFFTSLLKKAYAQGFMAEFKINIGNLYSKSLHGRLRKSATKPQR